MSIAGAPAGSEVDSLLAVPGGHGALRREGDAYVSATDERFPVENGVVRTLRTVDPLLARELEAQRAALVDYSDPSLFMPRYERTVAELAVEGLFGGRAPKGSRILDAGCGIGILGKFYPELGLIGLDASTTLLEQVKGGYRLLVEGSAEALPFKDGAFDVVVALNMLHHVITPENAVREFARVLRRGGTLVAVDPRKVTAIELVKRALRRRDATFAPTHRAFTVDEYATILKGGGAFAIEDARRMGLLTLVAFGGLDALRLSRFVPNPQAAVDVVTRVDEALFHLPGVRRAGLNLAIKARRV